MGSSRLAQWGDVGTLNRGLRLMSQLEGSEAGTQDSFGQIGAFHFYDYAVIRQLRFIHEPSKSSRKYRRAYSSPRKESRCAEEGIGEWRIPILAGRASCGG